MYPFPSINQFRNVVKTIREQACYIGKIAPRCCEAARHVKAGQGDISAVANGTPIKRSNGKTFLPRSCKSFIWKWV